MQYFQVILILMYLYLYMRVCHSLEWKQILDLYRIYLETWTFSVPFQDINIPFIFNLCFSRHVSVIRFLETAHLPLPFSLDLPVTKIFPNLNVFS